MTTPRLKNPPRLDLHNKTAWQRVTDIMRHAGQASRLTPEKLRSQARLLHYTRRILSALFFCRTGARGSAEEHERGSGPCLRLGNGDRLVLEAAAEDAVAEVAVKADTIQFAAGTRAIQIDLVGVVARATSRVKGHGETFRRNPPTFA